MAEPVRTHVSVGSNVEREHNVRRALALLAERFAPLTVSTVWESAPVGFDGDAFYNLVVGFDARDPIEAVAADLHAIEDACGRRRDGAGLGPRTMDLDLLLYGDAVRDVPPPRVPRDEIARYAFVLRPLAEIAGAARHPVDGRTFAEMWAAFDGALEPMRRVDLALVPRAEAAR